MRQEKLENFFVLRTIGDDARLWKFSCAEAFVLLGSLLWGFFMEFFALPVLIMGAIFILVSKFCGRFRSTYFWGWLYWYFPSWLLPVFRFSPQDMGIGLPLSYKRVLLR